MNHLFALDSFGYDFRWHYRCWYCLNRSTRLHLPNKFLICLIKHWYLCDVYYFNLLYSCTDSWAFGVVWMWSEEHQILHFSELRAVTSCEWPRTLEIETIDELCVLRLRRKSFVSVSSALLHSNCTKYYPQLKKIKIMFIPYGDEAKHTKRPGQNKRKLLSRKKELSET